MNKAQRLIRLMMLVNERQTFTLREMAGELGVSRRTVMRDLSELEELGVPLYAEPGAAGGYRVLRGRLLPPIAFTENEAVSLFFAGQSLQRYRSLPFADSRQSALEKFRHYLPDAIKQRIERLRHRLLFWVPPREVDTPYLERLLEAAIDQCVVRVKYGSDGSMRDIQPLLLYAMNGLWYCRAYCFRSKSIRTFRADRFGSVESPADGPKPLYCPVENPEAAILPGSGEGDLPLVVRFTSGGALRVSGDPWLAPGFVPDGGDAGAGGGGTVRMTIPRSYLSWAAGFFLGFGPEAEVIEPAELREAVREMAVNVLDCYGKGGSRGGEG